MEVDTKTRTCNHEGCRCYGIDDVHSSLSDFGQDFLCIHLGARSLAYHSCEWILDSFISYVLGAIVTTSGVACIFSVAYSQLVRSLGRWAL